MSRKKKAASAPESKKPGKKQGKTGAPKPGQKLPSAGNEPAPRGAPLPETRPRPSARHLQVYRAWCKKCGLCVAFCPVRALAQDSEGYPCWAEAAACTNCGLCELRCPDFAIEVFDSEEEDRVAAV